MLKSIPSKGFLLITLLQFFFIKDCFSSNVPSNEHRARENEYDLNFYFLDLSIQDTTNLISGNVMIRGYSLVNHLDTFSVELDTTFTIDSVIANLNGTNYRAARVARSATELNILLPFTVLNGQYTEVRIFYHGIPTLTDSVTQSSFFTTPGQKYSISEPYYSYMWFPCKQVLTDKADSSWFFLTTDTSCRGISNGLLSNVSHISSTQCRWEWKSHYPIAFYLISFATGKFNIETDYWHPPGRTDSMQLQLYDNYLSIDTQVFDILNLYSRLFGLYPFYNEKLGLIYVNGLPGEGMENQTAIILGGYGYNMLSHEIAHHWFGDNVTCASFKDVMINEGFATWCESINAEFSGGGDSARIAYCNLYEQSALTLCGSGYSPADTTSKGGVFGPINLYYDKNAMLINSLRFVVNNDSLFFLGIRNFQTQFHGANAYGRDLRDAMENTTGIDLTDFFNQWYYGYGYPSFGIRWNQVGNRLMLQVTEIASCDSTPLFKTPLELKLVCFPSDTIIKVDITQNISSFNVPISGTFYRALVDPNQWVLDRKAILPIHDTTLIIASVDEVSQNKFSIYPNPTSQYLNILSSTENKPFDVTMYDSRGAIVFKGRNITSGKINLPYLEDGVYIFQINESEFFKVIILN